MKTIPLFIVLLMIAACSPALSQEDGTEVSLLFKAASKNIFLGQTFNNHPLSTAGISIRRGGLSSLGYISYGKGRGEEYTEAGIRLDYVKSVGPSAEFESRFYPIWFNENNGQGVVTALMVYGKLRFRTFLSPAVAYYWVTTSKYPEKAGDHINLEFRQDIRGFALVEFAVGYNSGFFTAKKCGGFTGSVKLSRSFDVSDNICFRPFIEQGLIQDRLGGTNRTVFGMVIEFDINR